MARDFAQAFYKSTAWQKCRLSYIRERQAIDGGLCEMCRVEPGKIVHHKVWLTPENISNPDIALNHDNLRYECQTCHNREDDGESNENKYIFDASGQLVPLDSPPPVRV